MKGKEAVLREDAEDVRVDYIQELGSQHDVLGFYPESSRDIS